MVVKAEPVKRLEKSWQNKKEEEKVQEKKVEEKDDTSPSWDEIEEPLKDNSATAATSSVVTNEMTIQQPDFPYSYYGAQIRNAVEQNWRQTPQELLGSESQLVVLVKFTIGKNGRVSGLEIVESSWNSLLDKFALRAIEKAKIPPLPGEFNELTIHYKLVLRRK
jgi:TonB family protein